MKTSDFDYELPPELIAQEPAAERDGCRLLVMDRATGALEDRVFRDIAEYLRPGDLLVANETRVMPARLLGAKRSTGGAAEVFLLRPHGTPTDNHSACWEVLVRPGKRLKPGTGAVVDFADADGNVALSAEIVDWARPAHDEDPHDGAQRGERVARLTTQLPSLDEALHAVGHTPLPPYIKGYAGDEELYQTVYSRRESSAAAPTAGLHFTPQLIDRLKDNGVRWETVELEVGLDTFRIVDEDDPEQHAIHTEFYTVPQRTVDAVAETRRRGGRVVAVGTTSVRSLGRAGGRRRGSTAGARSRGHVALHPARLPVPRGGRSGHELPRAEVDAHDVGERVFKPRERHGRLSARHRRALPPALVRRCHVPPLSACRTVLHANSSGRSDSAVSASVRPRPRSDGAGVCGDSSARATVMVSGWQG